MGTFRIIFSQLCYHYFFSKHSFYNNCGDLFCLIVAYDLIIPVALLESLPIQWKAETKLYKLTDSGFDYYTWQPCISFSEYC